MNRMDKICALAAGIVIGISGCRSYEQDQRLIWKEIYYTQTDIAELSSRVRILEREHAQCEDLETVHTSIRELRLTVDQYGQLQNTSRADTRRLYDAIADLNSSIATLERTSQD